VIRVLVTGSRGQVGAELTRALEGHAQVIAHDRTTLDLTKPDEIAARIREARPDVIANAAAYTAVDRAEAEPDLARAVNAIAPRVIAAEAKRAGALLIHFSTDYVFDGAKALPYVESDATGPLNVYGLTKLEGEQAVAASGCPHAILRTSWVYGPHGANFMLTMLKLAATRQELRVVDDQRGAPTSSRELARATLALFTGGERSRAISSRDVARVKEASGLYHASAAGETTWCGFARAIFELRSRQAGPRFSAPRLIAIASSEYPTAARRPANSVLSSAKLAAVLGVELQDWRQGLEEALSALRVG
jgi:dTDP-4-dehydrorhamnose reductase